MPQVTEILQSHAIIRDTTRCPSLGKSALIAAMAFAFLGSLVLAQDPKTKPGNEQDPPAQDQKSDPPGKPADEKPAAATEQDTEKSDSPETDETVLGTDRWEDPRARDALENSFPELPSNILPKAEIDRIDEMAAGRGSVERPLIEKYIKHYTAELTSRRNLQALMDPTGPQDRAKALEQATSALLKPLQPAASGSNAPFRREYVRLLMANLEPLLDKQLHSRTFAMLVLARAGDPQVAKLLYDQIADPKQVLVVKLIAASGLSALAQSNRSPVEAAVAMPASRSLSEFLRNEREAFYPAHIRALEALGWMRLATGNQSAGRAELAETALIYLFDPDAKPEVRSYAAWALGMLQVPSSVRDYNFALIAYGMGRLALEIGQKAVKVPLPVGGATDSVKKANNAERDRNFHQITRACDMLLRILASLEGDAQIRDFGLLRSGHANLSSARPYVTEISSRVRNVTEAAYALSQSAGALIERNRVALETAVNELAAFLAQKQPPDNKLYRGGEEMALGAGARARGTGAARAGEPGER